MKVSRIGFSLALALGLNIAPLMAEPFGFDTTSKRNPAAVYSYCVDIGEDHYYYKKFECTSAPKPHPDMEFYSISFNKSIGICIIEGYSDVISDNRRGEFIKSKTDDIANQIKIKYGEWTRKNDIFSSDSLWGNPQNWLYSMLQGYRHYSYQWELIRPTYGIDSIYVWAKALDVDKGYVLIQFDTTLYDKCIENPDTGN